MKNGQLTMTHVKTTLRYMLDLKILFSRVGVIWVPDSGWVGRG